MQSRRAPSRQVARRPDPVPALTTALGFSLAAAVFAGTTAALTSIPQPAIVLLVIVAGFATGWTLPERRSSRGRPVDSDRCQFVPAGRRPPRRVTSSVATTHCRRRSSARLTPPAQG